MTALLRGAVVLFLVAIVGSSPRTSAAVGPEDELPDGDGKKLLLAYCNTCHELTEVTKFRGYYNRAQWRDIVVTMVEYGADLKKTEIETLADYLAETLGKK